jgi:transposase-like protein
MNLTSIAQHFSDAGSARAFLESERWPDGVICPFCGLVGFAYALRPRIGSRTSVRLGVWKCKGCRKQFTVTVGTIFEDSHIPLNTWLLAIHLLCSSKKGMSAHQLHRMLGITYKSAWFMVHRIRYAMRQSSVFSKMGGTIEIDETYIGGKRRMPNTPQAGKLRRTAGHAPFANKQAVVSLVERDGSVQSHHVRRVTAENLRPIIEASIEPDAVIMTDSSTVLGSALMRRKHYQLDHTRNEYVRYKQGLKITTNTVEGFFGLLKRGINGVYHHVGEQHLHRYLSEFDFRYNSRKITDGERTSRLIRQVHGKRLMYKHVKPE